MLLAYQIANCVPVGPGSERDVSTHSANIWSVTTKSGSGPCILRRRWNLMSSPSLLVESISSGAARQPNRKPFILLRLKRTKSSTPSHARTLALLYTAPTQNYHSHPDFEAFSTQPRRISKPFFRATLTDQQVAHPPTRGTHRCIGKPFRHPRCTVSKVVTTTSVPPQHRSKFHSSSMSGWICMTTVGFACGGENNASYRQGIADS